MKAPLFADGEADRRLGLEAVAEDGNPEPLSVSLGEIAGVTQSLAPVGWVVHTETDPFFTAGEPACDNGLEMLAEDGGPGGLAGSFRMHESSTGGASVVPVGGDGPGPIGPGGSYAFTISARPGSRLSIASMVVQSNDLFLAPEGAGIPLWDEGGVRITGAPTGS